MINSDRRRLRTASILAAFGFVLSVVFFLLSYVQKIRADKQWELAEMHRMEADHQRFMAEQARMQLQETRQALEACQKK